MSKSMDDQSTSLVQTKEEQQQTVMAFHPVLQEHFILE